MRAVVIRAPGGPGVLELRELPDPEVPFQHVRVAVRFAGVNRADLLQRAGFYPAPPGAPPDIPGLEYAGVIDALGAGTQRFAVGQRVFGLTAGGAYAEKLVAHEREVAPIPEDVGDGHAAAVPEAFVTAYDALVLRGRVAMGERVLVHAAGSGVGTAAIQIARSLGCFVVGTSRTPEKLARCTELGMHAGIVPRGDKFADEVRRATSGQGVDVVLDLVGGAYVGEDLAACAPRGRVVVVGLTGGASTELDLRVVLNKRLELIGTVLRSRPLEEKIQAAQMLERNISPLLGAGTVRAVVDRIFPLAEAPAAHEHLAANTSFGKVLLGISLAVLALSLAACSAASADAPISPAPAKPTPMASASAPAKVGTLEQLHRDAKALEPLVGAPATKRFLAATASLPHVPARTLYHTADKSRFYTEREAAALAPADKSALQRLAVDEELYYNTKYGSPLSYARALDILFTRGVVLGPGSRMLDFGYGYVGHLRLLATFGVDATGIDVDPMLRALYSETGDQGDIAGPAGAKGHVRLLDGKFPADPAIVTSVGTGYDLVISKNVLKRGYIHPDRPADDKHLIHLGASDEVVLKTFFAALKPGGQMLVYNVCPALSPPDKPFIPWSDGRSPWSREAWQAAGFEVLVFDQDDTATFRPFGHALGWDQPQDGEPGMDLVNDLSVLYTLVRRPVG